MVDEKKVHVQDEILEMVRDAIDHRINDLTNEPFMDMVVGLNLDSGVTELSFDYKEKTYSLVLQEW